MRIISSLLVAASAFGCLGTASAATLVGYAQAPAATFIPGPTSGQFGISGSGYTGPFINQQPVQGFSSIISNGRGGYTVLSDNGFGTKANSADALLLVHDIDIDFRTAAGGAGTVARNNSSALSDPNRQLGLLIQADRETYYGGTIPVDPAIRNGRLLTGADLDVESFRRVADGSYYFGDEFGPFLIHTDADFKVIGPAVALPGVQSPDNPLLTGAANLPRSGGFEGMALTPDGGTLYTLLEQTVAGDAARTLRINGFDVGTGAFTDERYTYELTGGTNIGEMTALDDRRFLVIERDGGSGASARFKNVFMIDFDQVDQNGRLIKKSVLDLLNIADPNDLNQDGSTGFTFPFVTIESIMAIDAQTLLLVNDNNFPGGGGRGAGVADNNEFILVRLDAPLIGAVPELETWVMMLVGFGLIAGTLRTRARTRTHAVI